MKANDKKEFTRIKDYLKKNIKKDSNQVGMFFNMVQGEEKGNYYLNSVTCGDKDNLVAMIIDFARDNALLQDVFIKAGYILNEASIEALDNISRN